MSTLQESLRLAVEWLPLMLAGVGMTLVLATVAIVLGLIIGGIGATMKLGANPILRLLMEIYTTIVRSVPELIVVYYFYFGINSGIRALQGSVGATTRFELPVLIIAFLSLSFVGGAYAVELFRTAYKAVPQSEIVAAKAFAMPPFKLFRRVLLPHIIRYSLPGLGNIWVGLLKDTALISVMGVAELMRVTNIAANSTAQPFVFYLLCSAFYLVIVLASIGFFTWLERRYTI